MCGYMRRCFYVWVHEKVFLCDPLSIVHLPHPHSPPPLHCTPTTPPFSTPSPLYTYHTPILHTPLHCTPTTPPFSTPSPLYTYHTPILHLLFIVHLPHPHSPPPLHCTPTTPPFSTPSPLYTYHTPILHPLSIVHLPHPHSPPPLHCIPTTPTPILHLLFIVHLPHPHSPPPLTSTTPHSPPPLHCTPTTPPFSTSSSFHLYRVPEKKGWKQRVKWTKDETDEFVISCHSVFRFHRTEDDSNVFRWPLFPPADLFSPCAASRDGWADDPSREPRGCWELHHRGQRTDDLSMLRNVTLHVSGNRDKVKTWLVWSWLLLSV